jgi:hypothetical protein
MPPLIFLIVYLLAVARITRFITDDRLFKRPRDAVIDYGYRRAYGPTTTGYTAESPVPLLSYVITCPWCVSIYLCAFAAPVVWLAGRSPWLYVPALALAGSYAVGFLASHEG